MSHPIRICLIATELRGFGPHGGFGSVTRDVAVGLAARGLEVYVAMPRKNGQKPFETVGGVTVVSYPTPLYTHLRKAAPFAGVFRMIDADVFHSQEPSLGTALAQMGAPHRKHMVTFRDPRDPEDWKKEWAGLPRRGLWHLWKFWRRYQLETGRAARRADAWYCPARFLIEKSTKIYKLKTPPGFLPNPVAMSEPTRPKAAKPTVCFLGRWDHRKRPELFLEIAGKFPDVTFVAAGSCMSDRERDDRLRQKCRELKNVEIPGWLNEEDRAAILDRAWILANTSTREGLPATYLEAGARQCAILSHCNPDEFASNFGFWAKKGDLEDFAAGLKFLLENNRWTPLGRKAHDYVKNTNDYNNVMDQHIRVYRQLLGARD